MSRYDTDVGEEVEDIEVDSDSKSTQKVTTRRRLEDYLHLKKLRDEVDYFMTGNPTYTEDDLSLYGLGGDAET